MNEWNVIRLELGFRRREQEIWMEYLIMQSNWDWDNEFYASIQHIILK
jgi:hypothetical protein